MKDSLPSITLLLVSSVFWSLLWLQGYDFAQENGAMENMQAACYGLGALLQFLWASRARTIEIRILQLGLGILFLTFILRELELERGGNFDFLALLASSEVRNVWLTAIWLGALVYFLFHVRKTCAAFVAWVQERPGIVLIAAGLFIGAGDLFDKGLFPIDSHSHRFMEELMEVNGALLLLESAIRNRRTESIIRRQSNSSE